MHFLRIRNTETKNLASKYTNGHISVNGPALPVMLEKISLGGKGCSRVYKKLQATSYSVLLNIQDRWENILNEEVSIAEISRGFFNVQKKQMYI